MVPRETIQLLELWAYYPSTNDVPVKAMTVVLPDSPGNDGDLALGADGTMFVVSSESDGRWWTGKHTPWCHLER